MTNDPNNFRLMADAQKAKRDAIHKARIEASPWLSAMCAKLSESKESENK